MFSAETYASRRQELRQSLRKAGARGVVLLMGNAESPRNYTDNTYPMRQDSTFLYYFGLTRHDLSSVMDIDADTETLYGNDYTLDDFVWMGPQPSVAEQGISVGVMSTRELAQWKNDISAAVGKGRQIHFLPPYRTQSAVMLADALSVRVDEVPLNASQQLIEAVVVQREVKSPQEIEQIEDACDIAYEMHTQAMAMCKVGVAEHQIAGQIEAIAFRRGAGVSFQSIVSQRGETLHNHDHSQVLAEGSMLLVDAGAENAMNYCSDFTRTIPVGGKFTSRQSDIYRIVLKANQIGQQLARAGVTYQSVQIDVAMAMTEGLKELGLMRGNVNDAVLNGAPALFMPHGLGHQMGLDVHDMENVGEGFVGYNRMVQRSEIAGISSLRMGKELRVGHVITVEPGIYFIPALIDKWQSEGRCLEYINYDKVRQYCGFGGIRLEDDVVIETNGARQLGARRTPITIEEVEAYCGLFD